LRAIFYFIYFFPCALFGYSPASSFIPFCRANGIGGSLHLRSLVNSHHAPLLFPSPSPSPSSFLRLEWHNRQKTSSSFGLPLRTLRRSSHCAVTPLSTSIGKMERDSPPCHVPATLDTLLSWNIFSPTQRLIPT